MKQFNKILISAAIALSILAPGGAALAQEGNDLGVQSSGLLPSNPFYFLKEWGRGFRKFITPNAIKKVQLELDVLNEKAAELKKLEEITDGSIGALGSALDSYISTLDDIKGDLVNIKKDDGQQAGELAENLIARSLRHFRLLNDLAAQPGVDEKLKSDFTEAINGLVAVLAGAPGTIEDAKDFRIQFLNAVDDLKDSFKELRASDLADRIADGLSGDDRIEIDQLREDLLLKFSGRLEGSALAGGNIGDFEGVSGDQLQRLRLIDEIREKIQNPQLRNELNILRQNILDKISGKGGITKDQAEAAVIDAQNLLTQVEAIIADQTSVKSSIKELVDRAKFNISQADQFSQQENYGGAFGQAAAAQAALKSAESQLSVSAFDAAAALESVKKGYDYWVNKIQEAGLTKDQSPKIFALLDDAERRIVALDKLIQSKAAPESIAASLRSIKILLSTIEEFFDQISSPKPPMVAPESLQYSPVNESATRVPVKRTSVLEAESQTVIIGEKGFDPSTIQVVKGTKVVWINKDIRPHWPALVASQKLEGFDAMQGLSQGESYSFIFEEVGSWKYHDYLNPGLIGVVEVSD